MKSIRIKICHVLLAAVAAGALYFLMFFVTHEKFEFMVNNNGDVAAIWLPREWVGTEHEDVLEFCYSKLRKSLEVRPERRWRQ